MSCTIGKDAEWFLEVEAGDIDQRADSALNYVADPNQRRLTFAASGGLWSLRFPTPETYRAFMTELEVGSEGQGVPAGGVGGRKFGGCVAAAAAAAEAEAAKWHGLRYLST